MSEGVRTTRVSQVCDCGGNLRWESIQHPLRERWLGTCECGRMRAFFPDAPDWASEDPLTEYLLGRGVKRPEAERPPWIRLMLLSQDSRFGIRWTPLSEPCHACDTQTIWAGSRGLHPLRSSSAYLMLMCLACGSVTVRSGMQGRNPYRVGSSWTPPDPAVKRLRRMALTPQMSISIDQND